MVNTSPKAEPKRGEKGLKLMHQNSALGLTHKKKGLKQMLNIEKLGFSSCVDFSTVERFDTFPSMTLDGCMIDDVATAVDDNGKVYAIGYLISDGDALEFVFDVALNELASLEAWVTVPVATIQQLNAIIKGIVARHSIKAELHYIPV